MRHSKIIRVLCLLALSVCLVFATYIPSVSAAQYDGSTEVLARIETSQSEATQPVTEGGGFVSDDNNHVSTGDIIFGWIIVSFVLFIFSALVILCSKKRTKAGNNLGNSEGCL